MTFDPNAPFEVVSSAAIGFDPDAPFEVVSTAATKPKGKSGDKAGVADYVGGTAGGFNNMVALPVDVMTAILNAGIGGVNKLDAGIRRDAKAAH